MLQWEGANNRVSALLYRAVIQAVLLFGLESWALSGATMRAVEGTYVEFLRQITGKQERRQDDREWETPVADEVLRAAGMQSVLMRAIVKL